MASLTLPPLPDGYRYYSYSDPSDGNDFAFSGGVLDFGESGDFIAAPSLSAAQWYLSPTDEGFPGLVFELWVSGGVFYGVAYYPHDADTAGWPGAFYDLWSGGDGGETFGWDQWDLYGSHGVDPLADGSDLTSGPNALPSIFVGESTPTPTPTVTCDAQSLATAAACLRGCLDPLTLRRIKVLSLAMIAGGSTDPAVLANQAIARFGSMDPGMLQAVSVLLLNHQVNPVFYSGSSGEDLLDNGVDPVTGEPV